jgi:hypothetical protein
VHSGRSLRESSQTGRAVVHASGLITRGQKGYAKCVAGAASVGIGSVVEGSSTMVGSESASVAACAFLIGVDMSSLGKSARRKETSVIHHRILNSAAASTGTYVWTRTGLGINSVTGALADFGCSDMDTSEAPGSGTAGAVTIPSVEADSSTTGRTYGSEGTASARAGGPSRIPTK